MHHNKIKFPTFTLLAVIAITGAVLAWSIYISLTTERITERFLKYDIPITELYKDIIYLDEVLTMSSRMASYTGDLSWKERYDHHVHLLDKALEKAEILAPTASKKLDQGTVVEANNALIKMEEDAFSFITSGELLKAQKLLNNDTYSKYKILYSNAISSFGTNLHDETFSQALKNNRNARKNIYIVITALFMLSILWAFLIKLLWNWRISINLLNEQVEGRLITAHSELEEFAYRTSHDLRAPLISSIKLLEITCKDLKSENYSRAEISMSHIRESLQKLETLVTDILTLSQTEHYEEKISKVEVLSLIDLSIQNVSNLDNFDRIKILKEIDTGLTINTQETRIKAVFENLISNAVKYHDPSEQRPSLSITAHLHGKNIVIDFKDNGLGIDSEYHDNVFKMFKRFHTKTSFGSGLGLYIVKKSIEKIGGKITLIQQDKGCLFRITLPKTSPSKDL